MDTLYSLRQASEILRVPSHVITYVLASGKVKEPLRVGHRRLFTIGDLSTISTVLQLNPELVKEDHLK